MNKRKAESIESAEAVATEGQSTTTVDGDSQRHERIAMGAYLRAEARGFVGGDPMEDWLAAEADVDGAHAVES